MEIVIYVVVAIVCLAVGFVVSRVVSGNGAKSAMAEAERKLADAEKSAENIRREATIEAKDEALRIKQQAEEEARRQTEEVRQQSKDMQARSERLEQRENSLDKRSSGLDKREQQLNGLQSRTESLSKKLETKLEEAERRLLDVASLSKEEAREIVLEDIREDCTAEAAGIIRDIESRTKAEANRKSREILSVAIQRMAADYTAERTVTSVQIPSDDIKGRIIGREGRNIRSFEQITGVNLIIDDTPETVTLSCFDPVRRETARITLENLIADGRIHPARVEEMFEQGDALRRPAGAGGRRAGYIRHRASTTCIPSIVKTLGRLQVPHLVRTERPAAILSRSRRFPVPSQASSDSIRSPPNAPDSCMILARPSTTRSKGRHAVIGADLARRYGENPAIVHAIEAHHADVEPSTVLAVIIQAADAVSAARPGARRESYENYIKRLEKLEEIANSHEGVERTYAMQAGREVRVMVQPDAIDDAKSTVLAHDIAKQIEDEMQYPGQIHVVVIRESRSEALAK